MSAITKRRCSGCCEPGQTLPADAFSRRASGRLETQCRACRAENQKKRDDAERDKGAATDEQTLRAAADRARRIASDTEQLRPEDFDDDPSEYDVSIGNVDSKSARAASSRASREKRQEYNAEMGAHAEDLKRASSSAHARGGDVVSAMTGRSGSYIAKLAEQERRFGNRRLARTIALSQAAEAMSLQLFRQTADEVFRDKITATGYARHKPNGKRTRTVVLLLSDLHLGAELSALDEPTPFGAVQEARRLEYIMRQVIDYKPQYRENTRLLVLANGDLIEGQLGHQIGAGAPLTEQKAIAWSYLERMAAEFSAAFPEVDWECQPGNHGRDKVRHPGRATWRKWDGHEWEIYYALKQMCSGLRNTTFRVPFRAVSAIDLHGSTLGLSHGDTELKLGHPDKAAEANARQLDAINSNLTHGVKFDAWAFGHFHTPRYHPGNIRTIWNGALIPPNGHARAEGYVREPCGQFMWEAVEGHPVGDVRFLEVGASQDGDRNLGKLIKPFRFSMLEDK